MRIAYFSDNFYPEISGISDSIITTGETLRSRGHDVVYVAPNYSPANYKKSRDSKRDALPVGRLPSLHMPGSPTGQSRVALPIGSSFNFLHKFKPDIIHTQSPYGVGLEALRASKKFNVPLIGTNHTPLEEFIHYAPGGRYYLGAALRYEAWYYNHCAFVSAPYQGLIDEMRTKGLHVPGHGVANPVPFAGKQKSEDEKRACKLDMNIPGPLLLSSGRLAPEKRVGEVIEAFAHVLKKIPDATMIITGHGSAELALKKQASDLKLADRVRFVGFVVPEKLEELYCTAEVYVVMSTAETQSLSLMQGFANGVPAVVAAARGLIDYCPTQCGIQVKPGDIPALAKAIEDIMTNAGMRSRMSEAAIEFVKKFTPEKVAQEWEGIFAQYQKKS